MKGNKFFIGVLIVSMMLMGVGYAAWTQQLTLNQSVSAGELLFNIEVEDIKEEVNGKPEPGYSDFNIVTDGCPIDSIEVTTADIYPGVENSYRIVAENESTMKTIIDMDYRNATDFSYDENEELSDQIRYEIAYRVGSGKTMHVNSFEALEKKLDGKEVKEGQNVVIEVVERLPFRANNDCENGELKYKMELTFKQYNDDEDY